MTGKRIKKARLKCGVTIPRLARFVGIDTRRLILIEDGRTAVKGYEMELLEYYFKKKGVKL